MKKIARFSFTLALTLCLGAGLMIGCGSDGGSGDDGGGGTPQPPAGTIDTSTATDVTRAATEIANTAIYLGEIGRDLPVNGTLSQTLFPSGVFVAPSLENSLYGEVESEAVINPEGCPKVSDNRGSLSEPIPNPWILTFDYTGCEEMSGSFTATVDMTGDKVSSISFTFSDFSSYEYTLNGAMEMDFAETPKKITANMTLNSPSEKVTLILDLTNTFDLSTSDIETFNGSGTFTSSVDGEFRVTYNALQYDLYTTSDGGLDDTYCDYPIGGSITIAGSNGTAVAIFDLSDPGCAYASLSINDGPSETITCFSSLSGDWVGTWKSTDNSAINGTFTASITQDGNNINGTITVTGSEYVSDGTLSGTANGNNFTLKACLNY